MFTLLLLSLWLQGGSAVVTGIVRTSDGTPQSGIRVSALVPPDSPEDLTKAVSLVSIAETDKDGRYRLENIPPGRYYIAAGRIDSPTFYPGTRDLLNSFVISISAGDTIPGIDFALKNESSGRAALITLSTFVPPGLTIPIDIAVEGGGKVPVFVNGMYPSILMTDGLAGVTIPALFSNSVITLPLPAASAIDEYKVEILDLPDGYIVRSIRYDNTDLRTGPLKASIRGLTVQASMPGLGTGSGAIATSQLAIVLGRAPAVPVASIGVRLTGRIPFGSPGEVYLSGNPGTVYSDGSYEFSGVEPGRHTVVKLNGVNNSLGATVVVGNQDVGNIDLRGTEVLPIDAMDKKPPISASGLSAGAVMPMASIQGHVVEEKTQEPIREGTITISGYLNSQRSFALDGEGNFHTSSLLPGTYALTINVSGYVSMQAIVLGTDDLTLNLLAHPEK
jgi:hypothetical protein